MPERMSIECPPERRKISQLKRKQFDYNLPNPSIDPWLDLGHVKSHMSALLDMYVLYYPCTTVLIHSKLLQSSYKSFTLTLSKRKICYLQYCARQTAPGRLHQADCSRQTESDRLHQADCLRQTAEGRLQKADCSRQAAVGRLHQIDCIRQTAVGRLRQADCARQTVPGRPR